MASPTFDETYNDLVAVCRAAQSALFECGRQLEHDAIEKMDSKYSHTLTMLETGPCTQ